MPTSRVVEFQGATAVVTGGASGIGRGMAAVFREVGCNVVLADRDETSLEEAAADLDALAVPTDVTDPTSVAALAKRTMAAFGAVHIVCNNAGVGPFGAVAKMTLADWRYVLDVNLLGVVHGVHAFLPLLEANGTWGQIVNTSSVSVLLAPPEAAAYVASKAAVLGLTEVLAAELEASGSRVGATALLPGTVRTNIARSLRFREPDDSSGLYELDLAARASQYRFIDPLDVGRMVLRAISRNERYVLTHPELVSLTDDRHARMRAAAHGVTGEPEPSGPG
ncbi:MAG: SDR family NAD(P)-dependent oxidoreductase [Acidimicrobiales bacterium]